MLNQLYLHYNKIENLHPSLFSKLQHLERLFLHENKIQHIQPGTFNNLPSVKRLRLDGNALVCDCGMLWFKKLISENMQHTQVAATCQYPDYMQGKSLYDMSLQDFSCKEPRIVEHPHDVEVSFGGTAVFTCRVDGDPQPKVIWMLNSNEIDVSDPKYSLRPDGSLVIAPMTDTDVGVYECMAKSPYGEIKSRGAKINYRRTTKPQFRKRPEDQIASDGDTIQLECSVSGINHPHVTWTRDDITVDSERHRVSPEGTLTIQRVTVEDTGTYRCTVESTVGRVTAQAQVTVNVRPRLIVPPESQFAKSGATVEMRCYASGAPPPTITWFKDGNSVQPAERLQFADDNSILRIIHSKESDSGLYTCTAQNTEGTAEASGELRVRSEGPRAPKLTIAPYPIIAPLGASVELPCKAQGDPRPVLTWSKDGSPVELDANHKVFPLGSLRIYNISHRDAGIYECKAVNENGKISAHASLTIEEGGGHIDDNLVIRAVEEAQLAVDRAVNSTLHNLFSKKKHHSPHSLMRLLRYPDAETRALVRPADVYENTLVNIRRHIASGLHINETEDFDYEDVLTPEQLRLIAELSGCMEHQIKANCSDMCFHTKYRTIDGTCNNFQHPYWGASLTGFRRILRPVYENGFSMPVGWNKDLRYFGHPKPAARLVSTRLIRTEHITEDDEISHMVMQWGQFLDHDLDHAIPSTSAESWEGIDCKKSCDYSPPCYPMEVPHGDQRIKNRRCMDFIRSSAVCGSGVTSIFFDKIQPREQINQLTAFIDGSQVYGFTQNRSILLRDYSNDLGLLRVGIPTPSGKHLLPIAGSQEVDCRRDPTESEVGCFLAGDIRVNEQLALVAMHTIWLREHNRIAIELKTINPHWTGDTLFNEARKILGAEMQHITYEHWLPHIFGPKGMKMLGKYEGYSPNVNPSIANVFATAALRFGHSLINPVLKRLGPNFESIAEGDLPLGKAFFSPWRVVVEGGIDPLMRGMFMTPAKRKRPQENLNTQLTEHLFTSAHAVALDLAAMNVQRSRDHGMPGYNEFRKFCNLSSAETFDDLREQISDPQVREVLHELYGHPGNIDVWVGGILEDVVEGARVGPTFLCLLVEQFKRIRDGDRFWYENPSTFSSAQLTQIRQSSLARVLCDNGDNITQVTSNVFVLPKMQSPHIIDCDKVPIVDLRFWYDCEERRESDGDAMEDRVEGLEGVVAELQRTVKSLRRRMKQLVEGRGCRDHRGKAKRDGDTWQKDICTLCECHVIMTNSCRYKYNYSKC
ncbi:hypothetical protein AAG570_012166 [Ranatra chinensis]|uniref:Cell adhesion molecule-related/down-regulated by oncogenes n=1 Tax=Ranatra chinensis TaxID=642074 RepID=A0ABD0YI08_9HEMI